MEEEQQILVTLENYAAAYCAKDINALMHVFVDGEDISLIGTGGDELCGGREAIKNVFVRNFEEATANKFEWHWSHIIISNDHAVVAMALTIHLKYQGNDLKVPVRWTIALRRDHGRWAWLHRHASSAAAGQDDGQAYPKNTRIQMPDNVRMQSNAEKPRH